MALRPCGFAVDLASGLEQREPPQPKTGCFCHVVGALVAVGKMPRLDSLGLLHIVFDALFGIPMHYGIFNADHRNVGIP